MVDRLGAHAVAVTPLPLVEETVKRLGVSDKPLLRATVAGQLALAVGALVPGRRSAAAQAVLAGAGIAAAMLGRRRLDAIEDACRAPFALPDIADPLGRVADGAESWPGAEPLFTEPGRFYRTDINLRPPAIDAARWTLTIQMPAAAATVSLDDLLRLELRERDAALVCVHNRPGWDRLGQQRWTGAPIADVLGLAGAVPDDPEPYDLVTGAVDGYTQVLPLATALSERTWVIVGMAGEALPREHGYPARVMTPGLVGQYNGVKWLTELRLVPRGAEDAWWVRRPSWVGEPGWPRELVRVKPMARIDSPANTGMPPRFPPAPSSLASGSVPVGGTAWAPPHGVDAVEIRVDRGPWQQCELARPINGDSWRRWRTSVELAPGLRKLEARCTGADGTVQAGSPADPFPHGVGAYHQVTVHAF